VRSALLKPMIMVEPADCQRLADLFVLPPRSPKLNGAVERAQRSHTEEFYTVRASDCSLESYWGLTNCGFLRDGFSRF
jgi:hypothetical protein